MTNDKNKTNNLVASTDDDPTAELEILGRARARMMTDDELEADANTYDCEDEYSGAGTPADRISHLKREIRLRDESIDRLQFDLEQLRSRWSGLDKEIKVRERLTDNVNSELRQVRNSLATTQRKYRDSQEDIKRLSSQIAQYDQTNIESSQIAESLRDMLAQRESHIAELEKQILRNNDDLASLSARIANSVSEDSFSQIEQKEKQSREQLSLLRQRLDATEAQLTEKDAQLEDARKSLHATTSQNRELLIFITPKIMQAA